MALDDSLILDVPIWPGSSSFFPGNTPFGFYDDESEFCEDTDKFSSWCSRRLGYPIVDIELQDVNFYAAYEEAITEYSNQVNTHVGRDYILSLMGIPTGSLNLTQKYIDQSSNFIFRLSKFYGEIVGVGRDIKHYTGSFQTSAGVQVYDLTDSSITTLETGSVATDSFVIRRVLHDTPPAIARYFDPFIGTGLGTQNMLDQFGWQNFSPGVSFMMMPMFADVLRLQAIEFNDIIRRSAFSFHLAGNRIRVFPVPSESYKIWFEYSLDSEIDDISNEGGGKISDHSNIPYFNMKYQFINDLGKQWIRKYGLALCKEMLAYIRGKYQTIPRPNDQTTLNADQMLSDAREEKSFLIEELKTILDQYSRQSQLERKRVETEALESQLNRIPLGIYVG